MRLVVDLQGAQGLSRHRGIGRYCVSLVQGLVRNKGEHEIFVALNDRFPDTIDPIRAALAGLIPYDHVLVWTGLTPVHAGTAANDARRHATERLRETVLASVSPDYVLIASLFEGLGEDIVTSIAQTEATVPTAVVLYDLIPLIYRDLYLPDPVVERWYENKLGHARNADLLLAISESARKEAVTYLGMNPHSTDTISTAAEDHFTPAPVDAATRARLTQRYGLARPFVMYTGGIDHRKNIDRLVEAFARLPVTCRHEHQLAIVCSIDDGERHRLHRLAESFGLTGDDVILTGYISETDLLACYRLCKLFVFPSWHEGFGLPALEAMRCGRAVIASNTSSLPEVVGLEEALFDPFDVDAISGKIAEVLSDDALRARLERHGLKQARNFTWDETARRAWRALEASLARRGPPETVRTVALARRPRLAYISPLPPEPSGISDYSAELLPALARHYRIEIVSEQDSITDPWVRGNCPIRSVAWFRRHAHEFDRILYHFGNSHFHTHMFDLLREHPGVVVLHDFFLSGIVAQRDATGVSVNAWPRALLEAHGWPAVIERFTARDPSTAVWSFPCNIEVLQDALGVIVHAEHSRQLARRWYGEHAADGWRVIPHLRQPALAPDRVAARRLLGLAADDFVVCSFGLLGPMKMNHRLLDAWLASPLAADPACRLVFVGHNEADDYGTAVQDAIDAANPAAGIRITGRADAATFRLWLAAADLGVQLRTLSRGETSGTVLDCMNYGMATIVNANGSMAALPPDAVMLLDEAFDDEDLAAALTESWRDADRRRSLGARARAQIERHHDPVLCAAAYADAIERSYDRAGAGAYGLGKALQEADLALSQVDWTGLIGSAATSLPPGPRPKRLFVDVSELVRHDSGSGIQRVVRSILQQWLRHPPEGHVVEPVFARAGVAGYRHARKFTCEFLGIWDGWCEDDRVEPHAGDTFVGLDLQPELVPEQAVLLQQWRRLGVSVKFLLYDLLPMTRPEFFLPGDRDRHGRWIETIARFDGVICISRAVADEFRDWLDEYGPDRAMPLAIDWFHLGVDTESPVPGDGLPEGAEDILTSLGTAPTFLTVGTLEPRKGHRQTLAAFETLWRNGAVVNMVFVGKLGWMMDDFARQLLDHPEFGIRLFWLEGISDTYLDRVYAASRYLLAASEGEGFGLPLVEAGRQGVQIVARDIAVFREVAGDAAIYFEDDKDPATIAATVAALLRPPATAARPRALHWQSWAQSAQALTERVLARRPSYLLWQPGDRHQVRSTAPTSREKSAQ